jgi:hypothetical protein
MVSDVARVIGVAVLAVVAALFAYGVADVVGGPDRAPVRPIELERWSDENTVAPPTAAPTAQPPLPSLEPATPSPTIGVAATSGAPPPSSVETSPPAEAPPSAAPTPAPVDVDEADDDDDDSDDDIDDDDGDGDDDDDGPGDD